MWSVWGFLSVKKQMEKNKKEIEKCKEEMKKRFKPCVPQEMIELLYDSPEKFCSLIHNEIPKLIKNTSLLDDSGTHLFSHIFHVYRSTQNESIRNLFLKTIIDIMQLVSKDHFLDANENTFLHYYSQNSYSQIFTINLLIQLSKTDLIKAIVDQKNKDNVAFYDYFIGLIMKEEFTQNQATIVKTFIKTIRQYYKEILQSIYKSNTIHYYSLMSLDYDIKIFDCNTPIARIEELMLVDPQFVEKLAYEREINYNFLNCLLAKRDYDKLFRMHKLIKQQQCSDIFVPLLNHHLFALCSLYYNQKGHVEYLNYFKQLIGILPQSSFK